MHTKLRRISYHVCWQTWSRISPILCPIAYLLEVDNYRDAVVQLSAFSLQKKEERAKCTEKKSTWGLFIASRVFSRILAIVSAMQHRQNPCVSFVQNSSASPFWIHSHHQEGKKTLQRVTTPLPCSMEKKNHHNIPVEWCLPLFHGTLPLLDCAILWRLNISFAGVVSTVLKRRSTAREAMLASSTCSLLEGWSSSSICCMSWKHNRVPGVSTSEAMEVIAIKTNPCFEPCLEDCSFFTRHAALGHGCLGTMALEHTQ